MHPDPYYRLCLSKITSDKTTHNNFFFGKFHSYLPGHFVRIDTASFPHKLNPNRKSKSENLK